MTIVVDTSVIVKWLVVEDGHEKAMLLLDRSERLACPDFALAETANVLRRKIRIDQLPYGQASEALVRLPKYFDLIVPSSELLASGFSLAETVDHSVYDCMFLALARREVGSILVTADRVFLKKCLGAGYGDSIQHLDDYSVSKAERNPTIPES